MENQIEEQDFNNINFLDHSFANSYESCQFKNCNFSAGNLKCVLFIDCEFNECDLGNVNFDHTSFQNCNFKSCKMIGLHFNNCEPFAFSISLNDCILNHSSFYGMKLPKTIFQNSKLQEVDFSGADLSNSKFINSDLSGAVFQNTNLIKVDFLSAQNYSIDPENNKIKGAKFSLDQVSGLLNKYQITIE
ncbi:pentapeptide repeat-containing protein [Salegentibacter sp. LM13S]|uniref:pentapeptide repeat-containing protein n=1 Tax=Salegentibacter lacus TaxID=2873599 RepID=UPI001CC926DF|nr:pentapeptide repeat-containing protein [Salegentibacter lacus]MBZ9632462.1 pentapeptide repeat-containing protein [Salegentibacter lacus]